MSKRTFAFLGIALIVILAAYAVLLVRRSLQREQALGVGEPFPFVELQVISGANERMHLPSGKRALVVFFSPNCPHCANELTRLDRACQQVAAGRVDCIAVSFGQESETRAWLMTSGLNLKAAVVADPDFTNRCVDWLTAVPLVFLVDENGMIRYKRAGERGEEHDASLIRDFAQ